MAGYIITIRDNNGTRFFADVDGVVAVYETKAEAQIWAAKLASLPGVEVISVDYCD